MFLGLALFCFSSPLFAPPRRKIEQTTTVAALRAALEKTSLQAETASAKIDIMVKTLRGRAFKFSMTPQNTVEDLKKKIEEEEGTRGDDQWLSYCGKHLYTTSSCSLKLSEFGIEGDALIHLTMRMRGGGFGRN